MCQCYGVARVNWPEKTETSAKYFGNTLETHADVQNPKEVVLCTYLLFRVDIFPFREARAK